MKHASSKAVEDTFTSLNILTAFCGKPPTSQALKPAAQKRQQATTALAFNLKFQFEYLNGISINLNDKKAGKKDKSPAAKPIHEILGKSSFPKDISGQCHR